MKPWAKLNPREKEAAVEPLWRAGKSCAEIMGAVRATSRGSIATIFVRLRHKHGVRAKTRSEVAVEGRKALSARTTKPRAIKAPAKAPVIIDKDRAFEPIDGVVPVHLLELTSLSCRWPVNGLHGRSPLFCGQARTDDRSYCAAHRALAQTKREKEAA